VTELEQRLHANLPLAVAIADEYYLPNRDRDELRQEAMIGLWHAATSYRAERIAFHAWAAILIRRRLASVLRVANAGKRQAQNEAVPLDENVIGGRDPHDLVTERDTIRAIVATVRRLPTLEQDTLVDVVFRGEPIGSKRRDNGRQRARRKLSLLAEV
jgi:RNA polymerase sporulation-specific sigma factor